MTPVRDLNDLYFFAKVADFGSYTAAAKALGLQTSKLSRRIAALEGELGVRLINRTTRRLSLTEAGKTFHRHCLALLDEAQAAKDAMKEVFGKDTVFIRSGGSIPVVADFEKNLGIPSVMMGFGLPDDNLHAPNEKFHIPNFYRGIESIIRFFQLLSH